MPEPIPSDPVQASMSDSRQERPLRADARRNRARILDAAEAILAARGPAVSTEEIAREAGVGIGTLFRHFPTKEALFEAVLVARLRRLADEAAALILSDEPGAAFFAFFTHVVEQAADKQAVSDALASAGIDPRAATSEVGAELKAAIEMLLGRAQRADAVRSDVRLPEVLALLVGASRALEHAHLSADHDVQARTLAVIFDGLRHRPLT
jgi:AcrR family transcriptional regulator